MVLTHSANVGIQASLARGLAAVLLIAAALFDTEKAWQGLNLVVSAHAPEATLMDMAGSVLHRWERDFWSAFP